jgi:hypothetical protein
VPQAQDPIHDPRRRLALSECSEAPFERAKAGYERSNGTGATGRSEKWT